MPPMAATAVAAASLSVARGRLGAPLLMCPGSSSRAASASSPSRRLAVRASASSRNRPAAEEWAAAAAVVAAALVLPEVAEAAQPGLSPSLKNFLLSILSGGVVLVAILGAVIAVSNFDPVKRG